MGHERLGVLPQTDRWRKLLHELGQSAGPDSDLSGLAAATLSNVRSRFDQIPKDPGVQAAFGFLLSLTRSSGEQRQGMAGPPVDLSDNPSALRLAAQLAHWVSENVSSEEYAELAKRAGANTIAYWTQTRTRQADLFGSSHTASEIWSAAQSGAAFSDISRVFLSNFVERYLKYFLEREASSTLRTLEEREEFSRRLENQLDLLSRQAFDTTKITQSFAAGWYNRRSREGSLSDQELQSFLSFAFAKLRQELHRETAV